MLVNEQINRLEEFIKEMDSSDFPVRANKTKKDFLEKITSVLDYLKKGAGIHSPLQAKKDCTYLLGLSKIWLRSKGESFNTLIEDIKNSDLLIKTVQETPKPKKRLTPNLGMAPEKKTPSINSFDLSKFRLKPDVVEKGDVVRLPVGPIDHFCLVCRVVGDKTYVIPITSQTSFKGLKVEKSRFFRGIAIYSILQYPTSMCTSRFIMPFDHKTEALYLIRTVTEYLQNNVLPKQRKTSKNHRRSIRVSTSESSKSTKEAKR